MAGFWQQLRRIKRQSTREWIVDRAASVSPTALTPLPPGWEQHWDKESGEAFYYNLDTDEVRGPSRTPLPGRASIMIRTG